MTRLAHWLSDPKPARVVTMDKDSQWDRLFERYAGAGHADPLKRILEIVKDNGAISTLIEQRYIDPDYRSEHHHFYVTKFRRYPSITHRLHFFTRIVPSAFAEIKDLSDWQNAYLGYSIMRPIPASPVGRTMIVPPPDLRGASLCATTDVVHPFGWSLRVAAMPYVSQDSEYLTCAHSAQWMVLYHAYLHFDMPRRLPSDIHYASLGGHVVGRQVPSQGLSAEQLLRGLQGLGISAGELVLPRTAAEEMQTVRGPNPELSLSSIMVRYVQSQLPPIVISKDHAWVAVGFRGSNEARLTLYRHDSEMGPYMADDPWSDEVQKERPWISAIPPLPERVYLAGEVAEDVGAYWLTEMAKKHGFSPITGAKERGSLAFRTYASRSNHFKEGLTGRVPTEVELCYRLASLPGYIWVVEAFDAKETEVAAERGDYPMDQGGVLGEAIIDATASHMATRTEEGPVLALHVGGNVYVSTPDHVQQTLELLPEHIDEPSSFHPYRSGRRDATAERRRSAGRP